MRDASSPDAVWSRLLAAVLLLMLGAGVLASGLAAASYRPRPGSVQKHVLTAAASRCIP